MEPRDKAHHAHDVTAETAATCSVTSWNVLADEYMTAGRYPDSPAELRRSMARWPVVAQIVSNCPSQLIALQEAEISLVDEIRSALGPAWDVRWCPKGRGRVDGCITAIGEPWTILTERRVPFNDGSPPSGHVAHVLTIESGSKMLQVANTHFRWSPPRTRPDEHIGHRQLTQLLAALAERSGPAVIAADANDPLGGPVRSLLAEAGWTEAQGDLTTAQVGGEAMAIDIIAVRDLASTPGAHRTPRDGLPVPSWSCPSDHFPIDAELLFS